MKLDASDIEDLRPVIAAVVGEVLERMNGHAAKLGDRLAFPEAEAAALCGLPKHVLRDARLRKEVRGKKIGKGVVYERGELLRYLVKGDDD
jgi:hypothetical protein